MCDHPLGFAQFGAGNAAGPVGQFDVGYGRGFVRLAVGPPFLAVVAAIRSHVLHIGFKAVEIKQQHRGF